MAISIQSIPTLTGDSAKSFIERITQNKQEKKGHIDFSDKVKSVTKILSKSKIK